MVAEIEESLIALLDGINRADGAVISREMEKLDQVVESHRKEIHPQLAHFLERRSYAKALAYVKQS